MHLTIGKKLGLGFTAVLLLMTVSSVITYYSIADMNRSMSSVVDDGFPTVTACDQMINGLERSLSALRGYMILGNDSKQAEYYKQARQESWESVDTAMATLETLYKTTSDAEDKKNFTVVQAKLK